MIHTYLWTLARNSLSPQGSSQDLNLRRRSSAEGVSTAARTQVGHTSEGIRGSRPLFISGRVGSAALALCVIFPSRVQLPYHLLLRMRDFSARAKFVCLLVPPSNPYSAATQFGGSLQIAVSRARGPEQVPLSPEFVPKPVYPEFMPPEEEVFPAEEQPMPAVVLPTTDLPRYIAYSDPDEDKEDLEEDPADYPVDERDDDDDDEPSNDDEDDDDDVKEDEDEKEEEHPALADSIPPSVHHVTAKLYVRAQTPISLPSDTEVSRLLAIPTPPPSPLSPFSSPLPPILSPLPQILSPPLLVSSLPLPVSPTYPLGYRAAMIRLRANTPSTTIEVGVSEVTLPPQKRLCIALGLRYEHLDDEIRQDPKRYVGYRITDTWDEMGTNEIYVRLNDAQDERLLMSGQLNVLHKDRRAHACTTRLMETEGNADYSARTADRDCSLASSKPRLTGITYGGTDTDEDSTDTEAEMAKSHDSGTGVRRQAPPARECTYPYFMKCKPLYFKGTEGVIELTQWFERMEIVFHISNCSVENQIKFATCTLLRSALTWWNSHVKTVGHDVAHAMT
ncbi:hypothetical protein Tco_1123971 [Tanacetum coccineum]|uniref:Reverse transcriptase domain-containing protein n=1 Tax=Tanacetum coccineum TaxID=301880 RepID=A0ABQ5J4T6_9ASTR